MHCCRIVNGIKTKNIKKQPWSNVECFAFGGATVRFASLETSFHAANHTFPPPPSNEGYPLCPKDKNRSPFHGEKPLIVEACSRWKRLIMVNSMQANEAPQERMSTAWRLHKRGNEPRRGSVMVKTIDATTTDRLRRSPLYFDLSPSCARKRACMELTTICRFQRI